MSDVVVATREQLEAIVKAAVAAALDERGAAAAAPTSPDDWLDAKSAAALLRVHPRTVTRMAIAGELAGVKVGRLYRFQRGVVLEWIRSQRDAKKR